VLHVDERGSGTPVVLLHGAPTAPEHMWPLAERLARSYRALVVHLPGYGRSAPIEPYAMDHSHALVEETLAQRGVRDAHVVGFSGGAYRAFALALRGNLRVRSVVSLAGTANFTDEEKKGLVQYVAMLRDGVEVAPILVELMLSPRGRENAVAVEDVRSWATAISAEHLARELEAFVAAPDLRPQLGALDIPVLARVGSIDAAAPPERSRRIIDAIRTITPARNDRAKLEEVPGVGHVLLREDFDSTLASIERHLTAETGRRD
jgi:pimeloyl-ACP methyl ester carboxylesterase